MSNKINNKKKKRISDSENFDDDITKIAYERDKVEPTDSDSADGGIKGSKKSLPDGYVCKACGELNSHAIYDCPLKFSKKKRIEPKEDSTTRQLPENTTEADEQAQLPTVVNLYISGLPFDITTKKLVQLFKDAGVSNLAPHNVSIIPFPDNPKKCKGVAFIKNISRIEADLCLKLNGKEMGTKTLLVQIAPTQKPKENYQRDDNNKQINQKRKRRKDSSDPRCYRCGQNHSPSECTNQRVCYRCKQTDHLSSNCPLKKNKN